MCAFYLTHNLFRSTQAALWGVISKQPRASIKYAVFACVHATTHARTRAHTHAPRCLVQAALDSW